MNPPLILCLGNIQGPLLVYLPWAVVYFFAAELSHIVPLCRKCSTHAEDRVQLYLIRYASLSPGSGSQMLWRAASPPVLWRQCGATWAWERNKRTLTTRKTPPGPARPDSTATPSTSLLPLLPRQEKPQLYQVSKARQCDTKWTRVRKVRGKV